MTEPRFTKEEIAVRKAGVQSILVEHDQLRRVEDELEMRILVGGGTGAARLAMLVAPSGCGKSTTVKQAKARLERMPRIAGHSALPILYCSMPAKCSIKTMTTALLQALGDPKADKHGSAGMNSLRIIDLLRNLQVRLVILDEFQHLLSAVNEREVTDWLKEVLDGAGVPVVCVGLNSSLTVINRNEQVRRRTSKLIRMKPFEWDKDALEEGAHAPGSVAFKAFLHLFEKALQLPERSNLGADELAERIHIASNGLVGTVSQLVCEAIETSMMRLHGPDCLTMEDFAEAYDGLGFGNVNPFDMRLYPEDIRQKLKSGRQQLEAGDGAEDDGVQAVHKNAGPRKARKRQ